ncbi:hypothetical protein WICMUC_005388 [Wickerhamomyces mucosus]|uniref:Ribosomal RNA-processing protein 9 n=1 Tax=Wickerhamomyces mucosus TaxID=1378264 RepID=A0A9P8T6L1_9ASCO|nr:hypothetical protein WICMUC_005388 [Wickerhamomyces mucosus]
MTGDPFLSDPKRKKRSRTHKNTSFVQKKRTEPQGVGDEEISGISDSEDEQGNVSYGEEMIEEDEEEELDSEDEFGQENAADKRRRLAKQYLENLKQEVSEYDFDAKDLDEEIISKRLKEDVAETKGHVYRFIADNLLLSDVKPSSTRVGSKSLTGLSVRFPYAYTISKDIELIKWDIRDFKRKPQRLKHVRGGNKYQEVSSEPQHNGHADEILAVAASPDGKYVVTGGRDKRIIVWSTESLAPLRVLETRDRRGEVLGLVFRRGSDQLYASCGDLKVRTYSINQFAQLEILYGHQDLVVDIAALGQERCVTVGARDRTAMLWKIADETRLTFRGGEFTKKSKQDETQDNESFFGEGSIDCVSMIDDSHFITGSDNGSIALWSLAKKKPIFIQHLAHGTLPSISSEQASAESDQQLRNQQIPKAQPFWITSLHAIPYSNVFFSGSWSGEIKVWKLADNFRGFELLGSLPNARGIVSKIETVEQGAHGKESIRVIASLSKEHRLGRWINPGKKTRNTIYSCIIDQQVFKK